MKMGFLFPPVFVWRRRIISELLSTQQKEAASAVMLWVINERGSHVELK